MEALLNALWLVVSLALCGVWWTRWRPRVATQRSLFYSSVALVALVFLLFPVISITDDLHALPTLAEEARSSGQLLRIAGGTQADPDPDTHHTATALITVHLLTPALPYTGQVTDTEDSAISSLPVFASGTRAPPAQV